MPRAVETFRWGGAAGLVAGLVITIAGLTGASPRADRFTAALAIVALIGLACVNRWQFRRLARATTGSAFEASPDRRVQRIGMICAAPAILVLGAVLFPNQYTWVVGIVVFVAGVGQLTFAARVGRVERVHGAHVLQQRSGGFIIALNS